MISSHLPSFPRQSFADKLRPAQNPWFASCGTSIHTSQSMQTMQTWDSTWTPTMCEVLDFVRLVSVLLRKNLFLRTLNPSSSYIQKTSSFCHKEFHGMRLNWHFIIFIIDDLRWSEIWDELTPRVERLPSSQQWRCCCQASVLPDSAVPNCSVGRFVSFCLGMSHCGMENASARIAWRVVNESMMWFPWQMMVEHVTTKSSYLATTRQAAQS